MLNLDKEDEDWKGFWIEIKVHIFKDVTKSYHSCFKMQMCSAFEEMSSINAKIEKLWEESNVGSYCFKKKNSKDWEERSSKKL